MLSHLKRCSNVNDKENQKKMRPNVYLKKFTLSQMVLFHLFLSLGSIPLSICIPSSCDNMDVSGEYLAKGSQKKSRII